MLSYMESFSDWYYRVEADKLSLANIEEKFGLDAIPDRRRNMAQLVECDVVDESIVKLVNTLKNPYLVVSEPVSEILKEHLGKCRIIENRCEYIPQILIMLREQQHVEIDTIFSQSKSVRISEQVVSINESLNNKAKFFIDFAVPNKDNNQ